MKTAAFEPTGSDAQLSPLVLRRPSFTYVTSSVRDKFSRLPECGITLPRGVEYHELPHWVVCGFVQVLKALPAHFVEPGSIAVRGSMVNNHVMTRVRAHAFTIDDKMKVVDTIVVNGAKFFVQSVTEEGVTITQAQLEYRIITEERVAAVAVAVKEPKRMAELAQPTTTDAELSEIGATVIEQKRIAKEIADRAARLAELEASPVPKLTPQMYTLVRQSVSLETPFGRQLINGRVYEVSRAANIKSFSLYFEEEPSESAAASSADFHAGAKRSFANMSAAATPALQ